MDISISGSTVNDDEAAAVLAAIACYLEADGPGPDAPTPGAWQAAAALEAQELPPARNGRFATWAAAERARRAGRWSSGIVGL